MADDEDPWSAENIYLNTLFAIDKGDPEQWAQDLARAFCGADEIHRLKEAVAEARKHASKQTKLPVRPALECLRRALTLAERMVPPSAEVLNAHVRDAARGHPEPPRDQ